MDLRLSVLDLSPVSSGSNGTQPDPCCAAGPLRARAFFLAARRCLLLTPMSPPPGTSRTVRAASDTSTTPRRGCGRRPGPRPRLDELDVGRSAMAYVASVSQAAGGVVTQRWGAFIR